MRLNRVHGPLAEAELTAAAERQTTPPRSDYVGEREEPVVTAKDLPLQRPARVFGGLGAMPGVTAAVAAVAAEAAGGKKKGATSAAAVAAADGAAVVGEVEMKVADGAAAGRRKEARRPGRGVTKKGQARGAGMKRHPRNKVNRVHRMH